MYVGQSAEGMFAGLALAEVVLILLASFGVLPWTAALFIPGVMLGVLAVLGLSALGAYVWIRIREG